MFCPVCWGCYATSNKTRIETFETVVIEVPALRCYATSNKTRIETHLRIDTTHCRPGCYATSNKTRIETAQNNNLPH